MTPLSILYDRLESLQCERAECYNKCKGPAKVYYSREQIRTYYWRWRNLAKKIKQLKIDIETHPDYERNK